MSGSIVSSGPVLVVGAGLMGAGIAQVAAQAGHDVLLFDARAQAAASAKVALSATLGDLVAKGRLTTAGAEAALSRVRPIDSLGDAAGAVLVVEAIAEELAAKRSLFAQLEAVVGEDAVLASNTSSISITALAQGLRRPGRLVGMHFFNPAPLMKLVEVVSGLHTDPAVAAAVFEIGRAWGKVTVHAANTPGFIVNRIARPCYAEAWSLLLERAAPPEVLDACLRGAGFRMGPCELMDLIGHDTNLAVSQSVFDANFQDARYRPSRLQREFVDGGLLGRKNGRGFYRYPQGAPALPVAATAPLAPAGRVSVHGEGPIADLLEHVVAASASASASARASARASPWASTTATPAGPVERLRRSPWTGLAVGTARLVLTTGATATELAAEPVAEPAADRAVDRAADRAVEGTDPWMPDTAGTDVAVFDRPLVLPVRPGTPLAFAVAPAASKAWRLQAAAWLAAAGFAPLAVADTPGLVVARTVAMLVNEAADAVLQGVCTEADADLAMKLGMAWPAGPFEWLADWTAADIVALLSRLDHHYRGERYRASPWLRRRALAAPPSLPHRNLT